jgi:hypothetical protein
VANDNNRNPLTNWPGHADSGYDMDEILSDRNANFRLVRDYLDTTGNPDPMLYFLLANDYLTLQDAIFSLQETLGLRPAVNSLGVDKVTVDARIDDLENGATFNSAYDLRHGGAPYVTSHGATWQDIYTNWVADRNKLTILGHVHDGLYNDKIDLASQVDGLLPIANVDLTTLTGDDILTTSGGASHVSDDLAHCVYDNVSATQTIAGPLSIQKNFNTTMSHELDLAAGLIQGVNYTADSLAWTGYAYQAGTATANGAVYRQTLDLRYWRYSLGLRSKVSALTSVGAIATVRVYDVTTQALLKTFTIDPTLYQTTDYEVVYADFAFNGTRPASQVQIEVSWAGNGKGITWTADSISIAPIHLAAYGV